MLDRAHEIVGSKKVASDRARSIVSAAARVQAVLARVKISGRRVNA